MILFYLKTYNFGRFISPLLPILIIEIRIWGPQTRGSWPATLWREGGGVNPIFSYPRQHLSQPSANLIVRLHCAQIYQGWVGFHTFINYNQGCGSGSRLNGSGSDQIRSDPDSTTQKTDLDRIRELKQPLNFLLYIQFWRYSYYYYFTTLGLYILGASEVSANLYCNSRISVLGRLRDYKRLLMGRTLFWYIQIHNPEVPLGSRLQYACIVQSNQAVHKTHPSFPCRIRKIVIIRIRILSISRTRQSIFSSSSKNNYFFSNWDKCGFKNRGWTFTYYIQYRSAPC